jgi:glucokinase
MPDLLMAADIGGTNTRIRLVGGEDLTAPLEEQTYGGGQPVSKAVAAFLGRIGDRRRDLRAACFGVAGRVVDGDVRMTNRPQETITDELLAEALSLPKERIAVVNDMVTHLSGVDVSETMMLRGGRATGNVEGIIMPGTGLGVGYAVFDSASNRRSAMPSEGGHLDFAPPTTEHDPLLMWGRFQKASVSFSAEEAFAERVSWEWLLSGPGLSRIYAMYDDSMKRKPDAFKAVKPESVTAAAFGQKSDLDTDTAIRATRKFLELAGARAGNLCLDLLATRALWLGGNILNLLYDDNPQHFTATVLKAFDACGPEALRETVTSVPIHLIRSPDSGLRGAAVLARERIDPAN